MSEADRTLNDDCLRGPEGRALLQAGPKRLISAGQELFREGEYVDRFFVLTGGTVLLSRALAGNEVQLGTCGPGSILGLMAALDGQPCSVRMRAQQECNVVEIARAVLFELIQPDRASSPGLAQDLAVLTIRRLRSSTDELAEALFKALKDVARAGSVDVIDLARIQARIHAWSCAALAA